MYISPEIEIISFDTNDVMDQSLTLFSFTAYSDNSEDQVIDVQGLQ